MSVRLAGNKRIMLWGRLQSPFRWVWLLPSVLNQQSMLNILKTIGIGLGYLVLWASSIYIIISGAIIWFALTSVFFWSGNWIVAGLMFLFFSAIIPLAGIWSLITVIWQAIF